MVMGFIRFISDDDVDDCFIRKDGERVVNASARPFGELAENMLMVMVARSVATPVAVVHLVVILGILFQFFTTVFVIESE